MFTRLIIHEGHGQLISCTVDELEIAFAKCFI